jgi:hypothetical protein
VIFYSIKRGVGKTPEILGLSEKYLGYVGGSLLLGFIAFGVCRIVVDSNLIAAIILLSIVGSAFVYFQRLSIKHGDAGLDKQKAYNKRPRIVTNSSRQVFLNLKK